jgi:hypothetical protein
MQTPQNQESAPVVYLIQEPVQQNYDLSSAFRYGKIVSVLESTDKPSHFPGPCLRKIREKLTAYRPEIDFIVWTGGDFAGILYAGIILGNLGFSKVRFLKWEREKNLEGEKTGGGFYHPVSIRVQKSLIAAKDHEIFE